METAVNNASFSPDIDMSSTKENVQKLVKYITTELSSIKRELDLDPNVNIKGLDELMTRIGFMSDKITSTQEEFSKLFSSISSEPAEQVASAIKEIEKSTDNAANGIKDFGQAITKGIDTSNIKEQRKEIEEEIKKLQETLSFNDASFENTKQKYDKKSFIGGFGADIYDVLSENAKKIKKAYDDYQNAAKEYFKNKSTDNKKLLLRAQNDLIDLTRESYNIDKLWKYYSEQENSPVEYYQYEYDSAKGRDTAYNKGLYLLEQMQTRTEERIAECRANLKTLDELEQTQAAETAQKINNTTAEAEQSINPVKIDVMVDADASKIAEQVNNGISEAEKSIKGIDVNVNNGEDASNNDIKNGSVPISTSSAKDTIQTKNEDNSIGVSVKVNTDTEDIKNQVNSIVASVESSIDPIHIDIKAGTDPSTIAEQVNAITN